MVDIIAAFQADGFTHHTKRSLQNILSENYTMILHHDKAGFGPNRKEFALQLKGLPWLSNLTSAELIQIHKSIDFYGFQEVKVSSTIEIFFSEQDFVDTKNCRCILKHICDICAFTHISSIEESKNSIKSLLHVKTLDEPQELQP